MYTLEDYAQDLAQVSESDLWGKLNVCRYDLYYLSQEKKKRTLRKEEYAVLQANKDRLPILEAEVKRRGLKIPEWIFSASDPS